MKSCNLINTSYREQISCLRYLSDILDSLFRCLRNFVKNRQIRSFSFNYSFVMKLPVFPIIPLLRSANSSNISCSTMTPGSRASQRCRWGLPTKHFKPSDMMPVNSCAMRRRRFWKLTVEVASDWGVKCLEMKHTCKTNGLALPTTQAEEKLRLGHSFTKVLFL